MAKIRLNNDKRDILNTLAAQVVRDTPIDPEIEKRVKKARAEYDSVFAATLKEATKLLKKKQPPAHMKILIKYEKVHQANKIMFVNLDNRTPFNVLTFNTFKYDREHIVEVTANYDIKQRARDDRRKASEKAEVTLVNDYHGTYNKYVEASDALIRLNTDLHTAKDELDIAEGADDEKRRTIMRDFSALITSCTTFEAVCEVWDEAKTVTDQIVGASQQISLMSTEAVERIQANMTARKVAY